jgi:hypothetical protein
LKERVKTHFEEEKNISRESLWTQRRCNIITNAEEKPVIIPITREK